MQPGELDWESTQSDPKQAQRTLLQSANLTASYTLCTHLLLTPESSGSRLRSPQDQRAASDRVPAACSHSGAALSGGRGWTSEPQSDTHSWSLTGRSTPVWIKSKRCEFMKRSLSLKSLSVSQTAEAGLETWWVQVPLSEWISSYNLHFLFFIVI